MPGPIIGRAMTGAAPRSPVILIVDPDPRARDALQTALARRFGQDYRVLTAGRADSALDTLESLEHDHEDVALVAAELDLESVDGSTSWSERIRLILAPCAPCC
jgi:CheY-like chemotaxis protein